MRLSNRQIDTLNFIAENPGCNTMAVCRNEWAGRGHAASYLRVERLVRRGLVRKGRAANGWTTALELTDLGIKAVAG